MQEAMESFDTVDVIVSFSSLEHDGQGRYGDPLDPDGDLVAMKELYLKASAHACSAHEMNVRLERSCCDDAYPDSGRIPVEARRPPPTGGPDPLGRCLLPCSAQTVWAQPPANAHERSCLG